MKFKNRKLILVIFIILLSMTSIFYVNAKYSMTMFSLNTSTNDKKDIIILIDPGHGGIDGGATSKSGILEKDINLKIGLKLKSELEKQKYKVIMTREEDKGLYEDSGKIRKKKIEDLNNRCKIKKDSKCNMFISIHLNMFPQSQYYGAQVWYSKNVESEKLAKITQENLKRDLDPNNSRKEKPALDSYKVLRCNDSMPSVLVECGFLSNSCEAEKLNTDEYQSKIVTSLAKSINDYYNQ
ncbi:N-acetylmuramoyl-L-alanine amidase CwlD [Clostridium scatologenes]|uniref:N-acetylmuramoyl-L-alanine amidase CwlD n=1 Tax=Clostridium scatologenes TaxID=1548 RepID=A0A0E3JR56_CLOSL|nr:N-acetylmuramoyl-L-alanine amidase CwlD [Clostridium scatologenes]AKA71448.1 N-acetylmuramoyl-L-alanine amidase CwlD [Clostridium scatologenes]